MEIDFSYNKDERKDQKNSRIHQGAETELPTVPSHYLFIELICQLPEFFRLAYIDTETLYYFKKEERLLEDGRDLGGGVLYPG